MHVNISKQYKIDDDDDDGKYMESFLSRVQRLCKKKKWNLVERIQLKFFLLLSQSEAV